MSADNAIAPFDFLVTAAEPVKVEVKATCGSFNQILHISTGQLAEMQTGEPFSLYRVYALDGHVAKLRVATDLRAFAVTVLGQLAGLPGGVEADRLSVRPDTLPFGDEISIDLTDGGDEADATPV